MTSLNAVVPDETSPSWRSSWSTAVSDPRFSVEMRVRHVAIRDAVIVIDAKGEHVQYKIEVMTKGFQWFVFHRYSDFVALHKELVKMFNLKRDMLPSKRVTGNLASGVIKDRRFALQRYLQRLVNSHADVLFCRPLLDFLDVLKHDVVAVTGKLAKHFRERGEATLQQHRPIHLTPNQCRCIAKRRQLPMDAQVPPEVATEPLSAYGQPSYLPDLFEICQQMQRLIVAPRKLKGAWQPEVYTDDSSIDISVFPSLTFLEVFYVPCTKIHQLNTVQQSLKHLKVSRCHVQSLRFVLADAVAERSGPIKPTATGVDAWRVLAVSRLSAHKQTVRRWQLLESLNLSYNQIHTVDPNSLDLVPMLEVLDLSCNNMIDINAWLYKGTPLPQLRKLDMSFNDLTSLVAPSPEELAAFPTQLTPFRRTPPANTKAIRVSAGWNRPSTSRGSPTASSFTSPTRSLHSSSSLADIQSAHLRKPGSTTPTARSSSSGGGGRDRERQKRGKGRDNDGNDDSDDDGGGCDGDEGGTSAAAGKLVSGKRSRAVRRRGGAVVKQQPVQAVVHPTPDTIPPPKYTHPHLINTESPEASLQQLQLKRSRRLREEIARGKNSDDAPAAVQATQGSATTRGAGTGRGGEGAEGGGSGDGNGEELTVESGGQCEGKRGNRPVRTLSFDDMESRLEKAAQQQQQQEEEEEEEEEEEGEQEMAAEVQQGQPEQPLVEQDKGQQQHAERAEGGAGQEGDAYEARCDAGKATVGGTVFTITDATLSQRGAHDDHSDRHIAPDNDADEEIRARTLASVSSDEMEESVTPTPSRQQPTHSSAAASEASAGRRHGSSTGRDDGDDDGGGADDREFDLLLEEDEEVQGTLNLSAAIEEREAWVRRQRREEKKRQRLQRSKAQVEGTRWTGGEDGEGDTWLHGDLHDDASIPATTTSSGGGDSTSCSFRSDSMSVSSVQAEPRADTVEGRGGGCMDEGVNRGSGNGMSGSGGWRSNSSKSSSGSSRAGGNGSLLMRNGRAVTASTSTLDSLGRDSVFSHSGASEKGLGLQDGPRSNGNSGGASGRGIGFGRVRPSGRNLSVSSDLAMLFPTTPPKRLCDVVPMLHELHLASNLLRTLDGLEGLRCLGYLDVRSNRLDQLAGLQALRALPRLNQLRIQGNGVARQRRYRKSIWIFAGDAKFIIDSEEPPT